MKYIQSQQIELLKEGEMNNVYCNKYNILDSDVNKRYKRIHKREWTLNINSSRYNILIIYNMGNILYVKIKQKDIFRTQYGQTSEKITKNYDIIIV